MCVCFCVSVNLCVNLCISREHHQRVMACPMIDFMFLCALSAQEKHIRDTIALGVCNSSGML